MPCLMSSESIQTEVSNQASKLNKPKVTYGKGPDTKFDEIL